MQNIDAETLKQKMDKNEDFVFLNVLPADKFREEHIPQSENIPYDDENLIQKVENKTSSKDDEIIVYCANTECDASDKAAEKLEDQGFTNVKDFAGGLQEWKDAGHSTESLREAA